ncbi:MAG TPA: response regulator [Actinomycetota bacterium]
MSAIRILVADDNDDILGFLMFVLSDAGYDVRTVRTGSEIVPALRRHRPSVVLMDMQLGDMDGLDATRAIKSDPTTSHTAVIVYSAHAQQSDHDAARTAGCDAYLVKPSPIDHIIGTIESLHHRRDARQRRADA